MLSSSERHTLWVEGRLVMGEKDISDGCKTADHAKEKGEKVDLREGKCKEKGQK